MFIFHFILSEHKIELSFNKVNEDGERDEVPG